MGLSNAICGAEARKRIAEVQMYRLPVDRHIFEGEETMILENPYSEKKLSLLQC